MSAIRILIADDHAIFRDGLRRLLEAEGGFVVAGEGSNGAETLRLVKLVTPDVLLLDLAMPGLSGLDVLRRLKEEDCAVRTVLLTGSAEREEVLEALRLGARGVVLKQSATELLHRCIRAVAAGEYWLGHEWTAELIESLRQSRSVVDSPAQSLTRSERAIIAAVADGATNRDIADQLAMSEQTVKNHLCRIYDKLGVSNRLELALFAIRHGLLASNAPQATHRRISAAPQDKRE